MGINLATFLRGGNTQPSDRIEWEGANSSAREMLGALNHLHVIKINGAFADTELIVELRDAIEMCDFFAVGFRPGEVAQNKDLTYRRFENTDRTKTLPAFPLQEVPLAVSALQRLVHNSPPVRDLLQLRQGQSESFHTCWARPANSFLASRKTEWLWHQDKPFHRGDDLTIWMALTDCGVEAPGLQFYVRPGRCEVLPLADNQWSIAPDAIEDLAAHSKLFTPVFKPGDCVIFDGYAPHRTHAIEGMTQERTSIDFRISPRKQG